MAAILYKRDITGKYVSRINILAEPDWTEGVILHISRKTFHLDGRTKALSKGHAFLLGESLRSMLVLIFTHSRLTKVNTALAGWNKPEHDPGNKASYVRFIISCIV